MKKQYNIIDANNILNDLDNEDEETKNSSDALTSSVYDEVNNETDDELLLFFDLCENILEQNNKKICFTCNTDLYLKNDCQNNIICTQCGDIEHNIINDEAIGSFDDIKNNKSQGIIYDENFPNYSMELKILSHGHNKLKYLHMCSRRNNAEMSLKKIYEEIQQKCNKYGIMESVEKDTQNKYKIINSCCIDGKKIITRGIKRISIIAVCMYYACLKTKTDIRNVDEISKIFNITTKKFNSGKKYIISLFDLIKKDNKINGIIINAKDFINRICFIYQITNEELINQTKTIAENIEKLEMISEHTPFSIAVSAFLLMLENNNMLDNNLLNYTTKLNISSITIKKTYDKLKKYKKLLLRNDLIEEFLKEHEIIYKNLIIPDHINLMIESLK